MKARKDGEVTRESILKAASLVFGEKGYYKATHAEIGRTAGVNTALINFHFGSKDGLYRAVWARVNSEVEQLYPTNGGIPADAPLSERLRGFISSLLNTALDPRLEGFHRIFTVEAVNPTGLLDNLITQRRKEHQTCLLSIIRGLLAPKADDKAIELCEMSVISQCHVISPRPTGRCKKRYKHADVESLTQHITTFSLAGIEAIKRQMKEKAQ